MRKLENKRMSLLLCGLLCTLLLSGCSGMLQSLADGTDAVLGGLAEGTDQVTGALADMTDTALDAAADATDDSVKDAILNAYGSLVDTTGSSEPEHRKMAASPSSTAREQVTSTVSPASRSSVVPPKSSSVPEKSS